MGDKKVHPIALFSNINTLVNFLTLKTDQSGSKTYVSKCFSTFPPLFSKHTLLRLVVKL